MLIGNYYEENAKRLGKTTNGRHQLSAHLDVPKGWKMKTKTHENTRKHSKTLENNRKCMKIIQNTHGGERGGSMRKARARRSGGRAAEGTGRRRAERAEPSATRARARELLVLRNLRLNCF